MRGNKRFGLVKFVLLF